MYRMRVLPLNLPERGDTGGPAAVCDRAGALHGVCGASAAAGLRRCVPSRGDLLFGRYKEQS